jgi:hypothetical protein
MLTEQTRHFVAENLGELAKADAVNLRAEDRLIGHILFHSCCKRQKRLETVFQEPKRAGRSCQGLPVRSTQRIPSHVVRWFLAGRPVRGFCGGSNGQRRSHIAAVDSGHSMPRTVPAHYVCGRALARALEWSNTRLGRLGGLSAARRTIAGVLEDRNGGARCGMRQLRQRHNQIKRSLRGPVVMLLCLSPP